MYTNYQETERRELISKAITYYLKGYTAAQIAEILGVVSPTVYTYLGDNTTICQMFGLVEGKKIIEKIQAQKEKNKRKSCDSLNEGKEKGRGK